MSRTLSAHTPLGQLCYLHNKRLKDVSVATGIHYTKLMDIAQGTRPPTTAQRERLAEVFKVPLHTFDYPYANDFAI